MDTVRDDAGREPTGEPAGETPAIPREAAEAVYAIMGVEVPDAKDEFSEWRGRPVAVEDVMIGQENYETHGRWLEENGIALTDSFLGARGKDIRDKVGVFVSAKRVGLTLLRTHARFTAGTLPRILAKLPGARPAARLLAGSPVKGLLVPLDAWHDAFSQAAEAIMAAEDAAKGMAT